MCSIWGRQFTTPLFWIRGDGMSHSVALPCVPISSPINTYGPSLTVFELFRWLQKRFHPPAPDTMANTALEAIASSNGKNVDSFANGNLSASYLISLQSFRHSAPLPRKCGPIWQGCLSVAYIRLFFQFRTDATQLAQRYDQRVRVGRVSGRVGSQKLFGTGDSN